MEIYKVMCKVKDDVRINPPDKTNKCKADDKENDEQVTGRTEGFFYEPITKKRMTFSKCYYCQNPRNKILKCFEYIHDLKIAKRERVLGGRKILKLCDLKDLEPKVSDPEKRKYITV
ncbi:hypothetical protein Tco_1115840 [Tanacetum coccineum]